VQLGVVILPDQTWGENARRWRTVEALGFDAGWTYDHVWWRTLRDEPWFSAMPVLAAAATVTSTMRIGLSVASPNFRHPVLLAKDAIAVDDVAGGRFVLGVGSGAVTAGDAQVLGGPGLSVAERADRFREFVELTRRLLDEAVVSYSGRWFSASEAWMCRAPNQRAHLPLAVAASGPRGIALAAAHGDAWISPGPANWLGGYTADECLAEAAGQVEQLGRACEEVGRKLSEVERIFIATPMAGNPLASPDACLALAERCAAIGMSHLLVHWPRASGVYAGDEAALERIASEVLPEVHRL
jgi:alkanesulfonate monooxygenase SsuD/methylene tetrahydromethanopterin reductase-like flavin-dependent oxidoreductase (luciferase family)